MRLTRISPLFLAVIVGFGLVMPMTALAHASYKRSNPAKNAVIPSSPSRLDAWFAEEVQKVTGANSLRVTDATGKQVDTGDLVIDDDDRTHMSIGLQPNLPDGVYTVAWATTSDGDGDPDDGTFTFTVDASATATPTQTATGTVSPTPTPSPAPTLAPSASPSSTTTPGTTSDDDSGIALPVLIVLVLVGVGAFLAFSVLRRRRG